MNIDDYRRDFAAYNSALSLAYYRHRAGLETELHAEHIYERYGDLFTRDAVEGLKRSLESVPENFDTERRGLNLLTASARAGFLETRAKELTEELARCESAAHVLWEGEEIPAHSVQKRVANETDAGRRRELVARWLDALRPCDDLRAARFESFYESAHALGFDSYLALYQNISGTDYEQLALETDRFLARTEKAHAAALRRAAARDLPSISPIELEYADQIFFQRLPRLDRFFPARDALATYKAAMLGLGIRTQQRSILIDDEARPLKNPRAACFPVNPPDDVRIVVTPVGGPSDYLNLLHEAGHAQHFAWTSRELAARHPEFLHVPELSTTEAYAFLFNHLPHDAGWLTEHRNVSPTEAREIVRDLALLTAINIRRYSAKLRYEISLHTSANPRSEQLAEAYARGQTEATGFRRPAAMHLMDVDDGFYAAAYLRAWAFEVALREHLRTHYGRRWWASSKAGDELIDLWNTASRYTVEELAQLIGFGALDFELLTDTLIGLMDGD